MNFAVPPVPENATSWFRIVDTFQPPPKDILEVPTEPVHDNYLVQPRSIVLLISH